MYMSCITEKKDEERKASPEPQKTEGKNVF